MAYKNIHGIKAKLHAFASAAGLYASSCADAISQSLSSMLSFIPQVQQYLKAEWIQAMTLAITGLSFLFMILNAKKSGKTADAPTDGAGK